MLSQTFAGDQQLSDATLPQPLQWWASCQRILRFELRTSEDSINVATSIPGDDRLIHWGCPADKIASGVPFYGRNNNREARSSRALISKRQTDRTIDLIDGIASTVDQQFLRR